MTAQAEPLVSRRPRFQGRVLPRLDAVGAWMLALLWIAPLAFAAWAAFHTPSGALSFDVTAPWTLDNFVVAWGAAPWPRYFLNTMMLVTTILVGQLVVCTLAGFAFARFEFRGREILFYLVLLQLFILPEVLIVENAGLGCDGRTDLGRIAETIRAREPDIVCLQEVARHVPDLGGGDDQVERLAGLFAGYHGVFGPAIDRAGTANRVRFGNMILSRLPVLQVFTHALPQPASPGVKHMPRQATEIVADTPAGPMRVVTTHLEYHSEVQRIAQADHLRRLQAEVEASAAAPGVDPGQGVYGAVPRPPTALYCGDFNAAPGDAVHALVTSPLPSGDALQDAWTAFAKDAPHPPTTGIFDREQWPQGPHARDYLFVTADVAARTAEVKVDVETDQSDHQPVVLRLR